MAVNEPNKPDDVKTAPANAKPAANKDAPGNTPLVNNGVPHAAEKPAAGAAAQPPDKSGENKANPVNTSFQPGNSIPQKQGESQGAVQPAQNGQKPEIPAQSPAPDKNPHEQGQAVKTEPSAQVVKTDKPENAPTGKSTDKVTAPVNKPEPGKTPPTVVSAKTNTQGKDTAAKPPVQADKTEKGTAAAPVVKTDAPGKPPAQAAAPDKKSEPSKATDGKTPPNGLKIIPAGANNDDKLRNEQEALLLQLDSKAGALTKGKTQPPVKSTVLGGTGSTPQEKTAAMAKAAIEKHGGSAPKEKPADDPGLAERKAKLEQELREKYGIPKTDKPVAPWVAPEEEKVVRIPHEKLHSFKGHPFNVDKNDKYLAFVASIRAHGVTQPAVVRPDGKGDFEIISGHRRDEGSKDANIPFTPCIVRALSDDQAIQQMVEDNTTFREVTTMELARALAMQLDSIKRQGARSELSGKNITEDSDKNIAKRSNEIVAERNGINYKTVQRYISLTKLTPKMQEFIEGKKVGDKVLKIGFIPAVELSNIKPINQDNIALAIIGAQATPSLAQAKRMRELDQSDLLKPDMIDGIMCEDKKSKEDNQVILSTQELSKYFTKDKTPGEMKEQIMKLLDEWAGKEKTINPPERKTEPEK